MWIFEKRSFSRIFENIYFSVTDPEGGPEKRYVTLFFIFLVDQSESELGILDLIQVFVEALDQRFENVCELDIVFHYDEVNHILDEIVMGGMVLETNLNQIMNCVYGQKKYEKTSY